MDSTAHDSQRLAEHAERAACRMADDMADRLQGMVGISSAIVSRPQGLVACFL